ncbi:hypothetical protein ACHQM5_022330 [Ranunculus cassubicifolius]
MYDLRLQEPWKVSSTTVCLYTLCKFCCRYVNELGRSCNIVQIGAGFIELGQFLHLCALSDGVTINGGISVRRNLQRILPAPPSPVSNVQRHIRHLVRMMVARATK